MLLVEHRICNFVKDIWQKDWNTQTDNKLYQIRPDLKEFLPSATVMSEKKKTVLCRLHNRPLFLCNLYLLKDKEAPWCIPCDERITTKHILIECWDLHDVGLTLCDRNGIVFYYQSCCVSHNDVVIQLNLFQPMAPRRL